MYSAAFGTAKGKPSEILVSHPESPEARPFGVEATDLEAVSPSGELAVLVNGDTDTAFTRSGTLARVGATGGTPREILEKVNSADWSPDGRELAIVRTVNRRSRLEFPPGKILYETAGWIGNPRFSPKGDRIAFFDHPVVDDDGGTVAIVDLAGKKGKPTTISPVYATAQGLAWSPDGSEVWFTAAEVGGNRSLRAASPTASGRVRTLATVTGSLTLHDVSRDGRVLVSHDQSQVGIIAGTDPSNEADLSWLDWSLLTSLSSDGKIVTFTETGEGGGSGYSAYIRRTDGSAAVRLGEGTALALSPDGKQILAVVHPAGDRRLASYPTGAGETRSLTPPEFAVTSAQWTPDGRRIVMSAREPGRDARVYAMDAAGGTPRAILPEGYRLGLGSGAISADGKRILARGPGGLHYVCSIDSGNPNPNPVAIPGLSPDDTVYGWGRDGTSVFVRHGTATALPARIIRKDLATGREEKWRDLLPADAAGLNAVQVIRVTPDEKAYAYSYFRSLSNLYIASGIR